MLYAHMRIGNAGQMFGVSSTGVMTDSELVAVKMAETVVALDGGSRVAIIARKRSTRCPRWVGELASRLFLCFFPLLHLAEHSHRLG